MKISGPDIALGVVGLAGVGVLVLAGFLVADRLEPPPMSFESIATPNRPATPEKPYDVAAQTTRKPTPDCTNGPQADLRDGMGNIIRLPVPARTINEGLSTYALVIPEGTKPGRYGLKLREGFNCGGIPKIVESPWVYIQVGADETA